ncbi:MAG: hypothetical protein IPN29_16525 [Saprospiraceae bacterium]|nr:hypothetical protein [Saprospiraceae bacterium]
MLDRIKQISVWEWSLVEAIFFTLWWVFNPYIAKLLTVVLSPIFLAVLLIAFMADKLDNSHVGYKFYWVMACFSVIPLMLYGLFSVINGM